jgi:hypothetical protein
VASRNSKIGRNSKVTEIRLFLSLRILAWETSQRFSRFFDMRHTFEVSVFWFIVARFPFYLESETRWKFTNKKPVKKTRMRNITVFPASES